MHPQLIAEYDMALGALEAVAEAGGNDAPEAAEARLWRRVGEARQSLPERWLSEWVTGPLNRLEVFECLRRTVVVELSAAERELSRLSDEVTQPRTGEDEADLQSLVRRRVDLMGYLASLRARLDGQGERIAAARMGVSRILAVALRLLAEQVAAAAQVGLPEVAGQAQRLLLPLESYGRLVKAAERLTGSLAVPVFASEQVARLRAAAALNRHQADGQVPGGGSSLVYGALRPPRPTLVVSPGLAAS